LRMIQTLLLTSYTRLWGWFFVHFPRNFSRSWENYFSNFFPRIIPTFPEIFFFGGGGVQKIGPW
jgi:hypothetical protein